MSGDVFRRVGRGGAGNFLQPKPADNSSKDLEAQLPSNSTPGQPLERTPTAGGDGSSAPGYSRAGRGGAGNYLDAAAAREQEAQDAKLTSISVSTTANPHQVRHGGRGGAGNWQEDAATEFAARREHERRQAEELERLAKEEVDKALPMPPRVHHIDEKVKFK